MKRHLTFLTLFICSLTAPVFGQAKIEGYVSNDRGKRVQSVRIIVTPGGQAGTSNSKGHFTINLPENIHPGQAAQIRVDRANWVIFNPMFGKCETKSVERNFEPLPVVIVPKGSLLALSPKRISEVIAKWADERSRQVQDVKKLQNKVNSLNSELDKYAFLRKYAEEYGFTLDKFIAAANQWAESKNADDDEERALQEYWKENYTQAAQLAGSSAQVAVDELRQANESTRKASLKVIRRYRIKGNSYYADYKFSQALSAYSEIKNLFETGELSKEKFAAEWADISYFIGITKTRLGERFVGEDSRQLLKEAITEYQQIMTFYTRESSPQDWASAQTSLGTTLLVLSERVDKPDSIMYLNDAVKAYNSVLEVRTREQSSEDWALAQTGLGNALSSLGELVDKPESVRYLTDAVKAYDSVLAIATGRERLLRLWYVTQINLGNTLSKLGERVDGADGIKNLNDAVKAFDSALKVISRERSSYEWAATQLNLGNTFIRLSTRVNEAESIKYLNDAVKAYTSALEVFTYNQSPQDWSVTQSNLGKALSRLGERIDGADGIKYLSNSVKAFNSALEVRSREQSPEDWVAIQIDLASTLSKLGGRADGAKRIEYLKDAIKAYRAALEVRTREQSPEDRGATYLSLGNVLSRLGVQVDGADSIKHLNDAVQAYNSVLEIIPDGTQLSRLRSLTQNNLGNTLSSLGERVDGADSIRYLNDAINAYRAALEVRTREHSRYEWAETQNYLGNASLMLSVRVNGTERTKYLNNAIVAYRAALEVRTREQFPQLWVVTQKNLARTYFQLHDWSGAAEAYTDFLTAYPNDEEAYIRAVSLYHSKLFKFDNSFLLIQQWLVQHSKDISAQADFAEGHFTMGRFVECEQRINALLNNSAVPISTKTALRAIEIASLLANKQSQLLPAKLDVLIADVIRQPPGFKVDWSFDGARYFIIHNETLSSRRVWLEQLLDALESKDQDEMLRALQEVRTKFKK